MTWVEKRVREHLKREWGAELERDKTHWAVSGFLQSPLRHRYRTLKEIAGAFNVDVSRPRVPKSPLGGLRARLCALRNKRHAQGGRLDFPEHAEMLRILRLLKGPKRAPKRPGKPRPPPGDRNPQTPDEQLIIDELRDLADQGRHVVGFWKLLVGAARRSPDYKDSIYMKRRKHDLMNALRDLVHRGAVGRKRPNYFLN